MNTYDVTSDDYIPSSVRELIAYAIRPYKAKFILFFLVTGTGVISWTASSFVAAKLIDELTIQINTNESIMTLAVIFILLRLANQTFWRIGDYMMGGIQPQAVERVRSSLYRSVTLRSHSFFANSSSGRLAHWVNTVADTFDAFLSITFWTMWGRALGLVSAVFFLAITHWLLALIFVVWLGLLFTYTIKRGRKFSELVEQESNEKSKSVQLTVDGLANNTTMRVFSGREHEINTFNAQQNNHIQKRRDSWFFNTRTNIVKDGSSVVATGAALAIALAFTANGAISIGGFVLFISYFSAASQYLWGISKSLDVHFGQYGTVQNALKGLHGTNERTTDDDEASPAIPQSVAIEITSLRFAYDEQPNTNILNGVDLSIKSGQKVGIVGHSGAGKTTLLGMLLAFYEPADGTIKINGKNYMKHSPAWVRSMSSFVPQDTAMFNRTIRENIAYARPGASDEDIHAALQQSQALEFVNELPNGIDTLVGERGIKLSGGQRQRIAIARAILRDSPLLLLDEATSALDSVSEQAIQKALHKLMQDRTAIVIAHRLSTLKHLDSIIVLEKGKIAEQGSHAELIERKNGIYADLWRRQKDGFIAE